jgi:multiple sugar transport system ATP-binding protein
MSASTPADLSPEPVAAAPVRAQAGDTLRINALARHYGSVRAVDGLTIDIPAGAFLTLLGPSGCGKSTTLSMLAGLERPDAGRIFLGDDDITDLPPNGRGMAMVFQSYALYPHMTVAQNIAFGLKMQRRPKEEVQSRVEHVARMLDLSHLLGRKPSQLSGGQQQRVGLGRALVKQPRVFLLDEPFSNLDAALRARMRTEIKHLHLRLGTTTVFVTHDQEEAMSLSDLIAVMKDGKVVQFGPQEEIYLRPLSLYVATFVGRPRMSLLHGSLGASGSAAVFTGDGIRLTLPDRAASAGGSGQRDAVLGVRAEDVALSVLAAGAQAGPNELQGTIVLLEPMGSDTFVEVQVASQSIVARVSPSLALSLGQNVALTLKLDRLHLFDAQNEERI